MAKVKACAWDFPTIRQRAYHEAGHTVMAVMVGAKVTNVTVRTAPDAHGRGGYMTCVPVRDRSSMCLISLAGLAAEGLLRGRPFTFVGARNGNMMIRENSDVVAAAACFKRSAIWYAILRTHWAEARRVLRHNWPLVRRIANELLKRKRIPGNRLLHIVDAQKRVQERTRAWKR